MTVVRTGPTSERLALAHDILELRADGFTYREIAEVLGISVSYVSNIYVDPDGSRERARKKRYGGVCETCGARTDGSNGRTNAPRQCLACSHRRQHEERYWTRERIVKAIRRFHREHGRKPLSTEWLQGARGLDGDGYPYASVVQREFGSWNAAIEAAGFVANAPGKYARTAETRERMRTAQQRQHLFARDYGDLSSFSVMIGIDQLDALRALNSCPISEHVRRAIDLYLAGNG